MRGALIRNEKKFRMIKALTRNEKKFRHMCGGLIDDLFSETGFLCVALAVLEFFVDQAGPKLIEIQLPLTPKC